MNKEEFIYRYNQVFEGDPWYGVSLCGALSQIPLEFWDQKPKRVSHSITEYVWHIIDWRKFVIEKVKNNENYNITMNSEEDWRKGVYVRNAEELSLIFNELRQTQQVLCELIVSKEEDWFKTDTTGRTYSNQDMLEGVLQHDIYHLGQLNLLYSQLLKL